MLAMGDAFRNNGPGGSVITFGDLIMRVSSEAAVLPSSREDVRKCERRHNRRANVVFCDGHVECITFTKLFQATNDASLARWNRDHQPHRER
jgi:prepilin-type processing-associated H-X9-DG protein